MRRQGLSRLELIVVIVLLAVGGGIAIPIVARMKEASRRTETNDKLKEVAAAVHEYHDINRKLPDGFNSGGIHPDTPVSIWVNLLPYLGHEDLYETGQIDAVVPAFQAPSDPSMTDGAGTVSFAANVRVFGYQTIRPNNCNTIHSPLDVPRGKLISNLTRMRIVDGESNTLMLATRYSDCASVKTWYATDAHGDSEFGKLASAGVGAFFGAGSSTTSPTAEGPITAMFQLAPKVERCLPDLGVFGHSFGTGGLSVALCDSTVRNINPTMTTRLFAKVCCPGDGIDDTWSED